MARETNEMTAREAVTPYGNKLRLITCRPSDGVRADIIMKNTPMDPSIAQRLGHITFKPQV